LQNCDCGLSKFDFRNSTTLRSLLPIQLLSGTFSSAQGGFKNQPKIFLELSISMEPKNLPERDSCTRYLPPICLHEPRLESMAKNMPNIAEMKLSSRRLEVADIRKNCYCGIAELRSNISLKVAELRLWKCFLQVAELQLRTQNKVVCAYLCSLVQSPQIQSIG
jgi:hypothetical protein